jgi:hypothetical protein
MNFRTLAAFLLLTTPLVAQKADKPATPSPWGDFVEKDFPFFSSVLDCRDLGEGFPKDNLTPRGLILNLGHNLWACFDTDLLRIACIWEGEPGQPPVTADALAPGSYHIAGQKTKDGQDFLPKPAGKVWLANGIYPGWQVGDKPSFTDPREPAPSAEEVGRGPVKTTHFKRILFSYTQKGEEGRIGSWFFESSIDGIEVSETLNSFEILPDTSPQNNSPGRLGVSHRIHIPPHQNQLLMMCGAYKPPNERSVLLISSDHTTPKYLKFEHSNNVEWLRLPPSEHAAEVQITYRLAASTHENVANRSSGPREYPNVFYREDPLTTTATLGTTKSSYAIDDIPLPFDNPWRRNVRLADIAFLNDQGDAAGVTFDGDVWLISGLKDDLEKVTWKRFASGLHEPMSIVARPRTLNAEHSTSNIELPKPQNSAFNVQRSLFNVDLFVFDRNGIWKLVDTNGDKRMRPL